MLRRVRGVLARHVFGRAMQIGIDFFTKHMRTAFDRGHHAASRCSDANSRGSVMRPVNADAATVAADAIQISDVGLPSRPLKLRLALEITTCLSPGITWLVILAHAPQPAASTDTPAMVNISNRPSRIAAR